MRGSDGSQNTAAASCSLPIPYRPSHTHLLHSGAVRGLRPRKVVAGATHKRHQIPDLSAVGRVHRRRSTSVTVVWTVMTWMASWGGTPPL